MAEKITVYLKPTCSKCRETVKLLKERGVEFESVNYYERPVTAEELRGLLEKLELSPRDILRKDEPVARSLGINRREVSDDELIQLMVEHPDLIQRPIVVRGNRAVLARPVANIEELL